MTSNTSLHDDIRVFISSPDGEMVETTNTAILYPSLKRRTVPGKAQLASTISAHLHQFMQEMDVLTHFKSVGSPGRNKVLKTEQLPFEFLLWNVAAGGLVEEFGIENNLRFPEALVEYYVRPESNEKQPVRVSKEHLLAFDIVAHDELELVDGVAHRLNDLLSGVFFGIGVQLVQFRAEFGILDSEDEPMLMLTSELSPDTMLLRDIKTGIALDHTVAFTDSGDAISGYKEISRRFGLDSAAVLLAQG